MTTPIERAWAAFVPRAIVGLMFVFAGASKAFTLGPSAYASMVTEHSHMAQFFPAQIISPVAFATGFVEIALGALLTIGIKTRWAARLLGGMMVLVAAGYGLAGLVDPVGGVTAMDIRAVNTYILPRAMLLIIVLTLPAEDDLFTAERLMGR